MSLAHVTSASINGTGTTYTISNLAVGSGLNRAIFVGVCVRGDAVSSTVKFNTTESFTLIGSHKKSSGANANYVEIWKLINPTGVTADVVVTLDEAPTIGAVVGAIVLTDVHQTDPSPVIVFQEGGSGNTSVTITTLNDNSWVLDILHYRISTTITVISPQTERYNLAASSTTGGGSTQLKATAGSVSSGWTASGTNPWINGVIEVREAQQFSIEQEGFRFRNDDDNEADATWRQNQDVNDSIVKDTNLRLRVLLNATGDAPTEQFQLEYKETGDDAVEYRKVKI